MEVAEILKGRGAIYGEFLEDATLAQDIKDRLHKHCGWENLAPDQKQALDMLATKMARIVNGNPDYEDNYLDCQGYCKLVLDRIIEDKKCKLAYDPNTGIFTWETHGRRTDLVGKRAGCLSPTTGYRYIKIMQRIRPEHQLAFEMFYGMPVPLGLEIDHVNRNREDNRIENLRLATRRDQVGHRGVSMHKKTGLFRARHVVNGKEHTKYYKTLPEAISGYVEMVEAANGGG